MESDLLRNNVIFLLNVAGIVVAAGVLAGLHIWPRLRTLPDYERFRLLLIPHTFRFVGLSFLLAGVSSEELVKSQFALPAAWGDFTAAVLALLCVVALTRRWSFAIPLVWMMNLWGTLDLIYANVNGGTLDQTGPSAFGATYFIPTVLVPVLFVSHYLMFIILVRRLGALRVSAEGSAEERQVAVAAGERDAEPVVRE